MTMAPRLKNMLPAYPNIQSMGGTSFKEFVKSATGTGKHPVFKGGGRYEEAAGMHTIGMRQGDLTVQVKANYSEMHRVQKNIENFGTMMNIALRQGTREALLATRKYVSEHKTKGPGMAEKYRDAKQKVANAFRLAGGDISSRSQTRIRFMAQNEEGVKGQGKSKKHGTFKLSHALNFGTWHKYLGDNGRVEDNVGWEEYFKAGRKGRRKVKSRRRAMIGGIVLPGAKGFTRRRGRNKVLPFEDKTIATKKTRKTTRKNTKTYSDRDKERMYRKSTAFTIKTRSRLGGYNPFPELNWIQFYIDLAHRYVAEATWTVTKAALTGKDGFKTALSKSKSEWSSRESRKILGLNRKLIHSESGKYLKKTGQYDTRGFMGLR